MGPLGPAMKASGGRATRSAGILKVPVRVFRDATGQELDDQILDGRHRYRACKRAGVEPRFKPYRGKDAVAFVLAVNLKRRHLDEGQRAAVAEKLANLERGGDRGNQHTGGKAQPCAMPPGGSAPPPITIKQAAAMLNVSPRAVNQVREIRRSGNSDLIRQVEQGEIRVSKAVQLARQASPAPKAAPAAKRDRFTLEQWARLGKDERAGAMACRAGTST